ncbi:MAG TPA: lysylphosphatidylglycerol synthase transmembrane domain-containing protein [Solirubrobacterales bacterium]|nr:lysylphosphatidylglycerol synthase transmembrane domain-containing protein [Solirubrobacterales bacterium]
MRPATSGETASPPQSNPLWRRLARIAIWVGGVAGTIAVLDLLGIPVSEWIREMVRKLDDIPPWALVAGIGLQTAQTSLAALTWFGILRAALPETPIPYRLILACYATAVALNAFLPANIGTWVMLLMFTTLLTGATFTMVFSGLIVEKIFFTVFNVGVYLYLFLSVSGSFGIKLGFLEDHQALVFMIIIGAVVLLALLGRIFWARLEKLRREAAAGGAILRSPRRTFFGLFLPSLGSYAARLAIVGVFLGAYGIPVTFHNIATVTASNSISNSVSATPGGVGVTQAMNTAALSGSVDAATATAYSIGQQLVTSAWNVVFAVVVVSWVFGWTGGKALVESSYSDAKVKSKEMRDKHKRKKD